MKRLLFTFFILLVLLITTVPGMTQEDPVFQVEITGVNPTSPPAAVITATVYDSLRQPIFGLTQENFAVTGELAEEATIVSVENITDDNLAFAVVLGIDTSSSMAGFPLQKAQEAARTFINSIGPNDPVAIVTWGTTAQLVQDYTTDKNVLLNAIDNLGFGGKTVLYDGGALVVDRAANAPLSRRAAILLSDGAEFGNLSRNSRGAALNNAIVGGVPVYTIGLGYGVDRSYLQSLSDGTNAQFFESPTPDQLLEIYNGLASTLRSQYVITVDIDVPGDGTEYDLILEVATPEGTATANTIFRAPIPVPLVSLSALPEGEISESVGVTAEVTADDAISAAEFTLDGVSVATFDAPPYSYTIDPVALQPGTHTLEFSVTDETGDTTTASSEFTVAALPPVLNISSGLLEGEISEPVTVSVDVSGQTAPDSVTFSIDGVEAATVTEAPFDFVVDPFTLSPGEHTLTVTALNAGGASASVDQAFSVATLPPVVNINGLEAGQLVSGTATVDIEVAASQSAITSISANAGSVTFDDVIDSNSASFTINAADLQPGITTFQTTITDSSGQSTTNSVEFVVAALPPQVTVAGLELGEVLEENRSVEVEVVSQTAVTGVDFQLDGEPLPTQTEAPFALELDVLELGPGSHILSITVTNSGGQSTTVDSTFSVSEGPSLTATASVPTPTLPPTETSEATVEPTSETLEATVVEDATVVTDEASGQAVEPTADTQATDDAQGTADAQATLDLQATLDAQGTADAQATGDAEDAANAQATGDAEDAANAQATSDAEEAANAQATADAQATTDAEAVVTEGATQVEPTAEEATEVAQVATATATDEDTANATAEPVGTLIPESVPGQADTGSSIIPIVALCIGGILILIIVFILMRGRRNNNTAAR